VFEKISLQALVDSATVNHKTTEMSAQENLF
jgi:hypothetical protein